MATEHTADGPIHGGWMGLNAWDMALDTALMTDDDEAVTRLLAIREAWLIARECMSICNRCDQWYHEEDRCRCVSSWDGFDGD